MYKNFDIYDFYKENGYSDIVNYVYYLKTNRYTLEALNKLSFDSSPYFHYKMKKLAGEKNLNEEKYQEDVILAKMISFILSTLFIDNKYELYFDEFGKPYIKDYKYKISIAHSYPFACVGLSILPIGIDIESKRKDEEIKNSKVITKEEAEICNDSYVRAWCIKEAIYKCYSNKPFNFKAKLEKGDSRSWYKFDNSGLLCVKSETLTGSNKEYFCLTIATTESARSYVYDMGV